jgi:hypothetical protein
MRKQASLFLLFILCTPLHGSEGDKFNKKVDKLGITLDILTSPKHRRNGKKVHRMPSSLSNKKASTDEVKIHYASGLNVPLEAIEREDFLSSIDGVIFEEVMYNKEMILKSYKLNKQDLYGMKRFLEEKKIIYITLKGHEDFKVILYRTAENNYLYYFEEYLSDPNYNRFLYSLRSLLFHKLDLKSDIKNFSEFAMENWQEAQQNYPTTKLTIKGKKNRRKDKA